MQLVKLQFGRWQFAPTLWPTLATLLLFGLTLALGNWQSARAQYKRDLQARYDATAQQFPILAGGAPLDKNGVLYRKVEASGVFDPAHEILLDNRVHNGIAGYHVLTPLRISGSDMHVLVNRGWIAVGKDRGMLPQIASVPGTVKLEGIALDPYTRYFELSGAAPQGKVWQNLNFERYAASSGLRLQPILLQQGNDSGDGLLRAWPRPDTGIAMHTSYALQWYGLAATLVVLWLAMNIRRNDNKT